MQWEKGWSCSYVGVPDVLMIISACTENKQGLKSMSRSNLAMQDNCVVYTILTEEVNMSFLHLRGKQTKLHQLERGCTIGFQYSSIFFHYLHECENGGGQVLYGFAARIVVDKVQDATWPYDPCRCLHKVSDGLLRAFVNHKLQVGWARSTCWRHDMIRRTEQ